MAARFKITQRMVDAAMNVQLSELEKDGVIDVNAIDEDVMRRSYEVLELMLRAAADQAMIDHENQKPRFSVPLGQTPLDDNLHHPLLTVLNEGREAFKHRTVNPYAPHSLEAGLHGWGWVIQDLRDALDHEKSRKQTSKTETLQAKHDAWETGWKAGYHDASHSSEYRTVNPYR